MSEVAVLTGLTWEEFLDLPDDDIYKHAELIDGEVVLNPPTLLHQLVVGRLWSAIDAWIRAGESRGLVTMDPPVQMGPKRGYLPDVAWYPQERCTPPGQPPSITGPPGLVAEVLSPSTRSLDQVRKRADYARAGVAELWLIDPAGPLAAVLRPPESGTPDDFVLTAELGPDDELTSPLLPGLAVRVGDLTAR